MIAVLLFAIVPICEPVAERVDLIEVNHFYDENGKANFSQVIFYDWRPSESHYHVRAWRLVKNDSQRPRMDWGGREWVSRWHDGERFREVRSSAFRETWTQYDPELFERDILPKEKRIGLLFERAGE